MSTATISSPRISVRAIHTDADLAAAQRRILTLWGSRPGTKAGDEYEVLTDLIEAYEQRHHPVPDAGGIGSLRALMDGNDLNQGDLPEIGSQGIVSQILSGQRQLNLRQIKALAARFHVPPGVFI